MEVPQTSHSYTFSWGRYMIGIIFASIVFHLLYFLIITKGQELAMLGIPGLPLLMIYLFATTVWDRNRFTLYNVLITFAIWTVFGSFLGLLLANREEQLNVMTFVLVIDVIIFGLAALIHWRQHKGAQSKI